MRAKTLTLMLCAGLAGCAALFPPSELVRLQTATPNQVVYEYARTTGSDFPRALEAAGRDCSPGGKRAQLVSMGVKNADRGWIIFECV